MKNLNKLYCFQNLSGWFYNFIYIVLDKWVATKVVTACRLHNII